MKKAACCLLLIIPLILISSDSYSQPMRGANRKKVIMPSMMINFNVFDVAMYGPIVQLEARLSGMHYLVPFIRYSYAGVLSTYQWTNFEDDSKYDPTSIAGGIGYKKFLALENRKHFVYYGAIAEFIHEKGLHNIDPAYVYDEYEQTRYAAALYGNIGYRWIVKRAFFLNLGITPGVAFDIKNKGYYTQGASEGLEFGDYAKTTFIGIIDFSFGWRIKRGY